MDHGRATNRPARRKFGGAMEAARDPGAASMKMRREGEPPQSPNSADRTRWD
jgi:hypothetical protein